MLYPAELERVRWLDCQTWPDKASWLLGPGSPTAQTS